METYFNTYHQKEMAWCPKDAHIIPIIDGQMCSAQRTLEKAQRLAAFYLAKGTFKEARVILAPCMFSDPACHIDLPGPSAAMIDAARAFNPKTEPWRRQAYFRAYALSETYM